MVQLASVLGWMWVQNRICIRGPPPWRPNGANINRFIALKETTLGNVEVQILLCEHGRVIQPYPNLGFPNCKQDISNTFVFGLCKGFMGYYIKELGTNAWYISVLRKMPFLIKPAL